MTKNSASGRDAVSWRVSAISGHWVTVSRQPWEAVRDAGPPYDVDVRLGRNESGRLFVTGLRIGVPDGAPPPAVPYEIKDIRRVHLGEIVRAIRESIASREPIWTTPLPGVGQSLAELLRDGAELAQTTVRRGPRGDTEAAVRALRLYEDALAGRLPAPDDRPLTPTAAVHALSDRYLYVSESQIYRRLAKARSMRREEKP